MKVVFLAALLLGSACFSHQGYRRDPYYDGSRYDNRYDRYNRSSRIERGRYRPHARYSGQVIGRLPPGARIERRGYETYARAGGRLLFWDEERGVWVVLR